MEQRSSYKRPQDLVIPLLAIMGIGNALMVPIATANELGVFLACLWTGVICAQVALVSAWIALAPIRLVSRVFFGTVTGLLLFGMMILGVVAIIAEDAEGQLEFTRFAVNALCALPLISLAAQSPHWIVRICLRWHVTAPDLGRADSTERPLSIRDMFTATAAVAVVFALARVVRAVPFTDESTMMVELLLIASVVAIVSAATTLPLTLAILNSRDPVRGCGYALLVYGILLSLSAMAVASMAGFGGAPVQVFLFPMATIGSFLATQTGILFVARKCGVQFATRTRTGEPSRRAEVNATKASPPDSGA